MTGPIAAALVLADGSVFEGESLGTGSSQAAPVATGEVVFNTALSGYQEIITDPSYAGQIITFTYPHIGNYGTNREDNESRGVFARGVVVRDLARRASSWRSETPLHKFLNDHELPAIGGIDTRRLTRMIRDSGAIPGAFGPTEGPGAFDLAALSAAAKAEPGTDGVDLVIQVTTPEPYTIAGGPRKVVALDYGMKSNIGRMLSRHASVEVVPAYTSAEEILAMEPNGVFLSNGPGDPNMAQPAIDNIRKLLGEVPIFGICLGHQLLSLAIGGTIEKLPFGHHGANHPVKNLATGKVEITSQNHNFAVVADSITSVAEVSHINLNDGVCEGMVLTDVPAFSVQHHPEASPGPHDSGYLFDSFVDLMDKVGR